MATEQKTKKVIEIDVKASADAVKVMREMQRSMRELEDNAKRTEQRMKDFGTGMKSLFAGFSFHQVVSGFKDIVDQIDNMNDSAQSLGMSVEQLSEWSHAAQMSGVSTDELSAGIRGMAKSMNDLGNETSQASKFLKDAGVAANDTTDQALTKMADAFQKLKDGPQKTALAMDIFGKAGAKLLPMLNDGAEGVRKFKEEAARLGKVLSSETAQAAANFNDNIDRITGQIKGLTFQFAEGLFPALNAITDELSKAGGETDAFREAGEALGDVLVFVNKMAIGVVATFKGIGKAIGVLVAADVAILSGEFSQAVTIVKEGMSDISDETAAAGAKMIALDEALARARYNASREFIGPKMGGPTGGGKEPGPKDSGKSPVDKTTEELKRFIEQMEKAARATMDLSHAEELANLVADQHLKTLTAQQQALKKQAEAAAEMATNAEFNAQREKERLAGEADRLKELGTARDKANEEAKRQTDQLAATREQFLRMGDPTRAIVAQIEELNKAMVGVTDPATIAALEKVGVILDKQWLEAMKKLNGETPKLKSDVEQLADLLKSGIIDFAKDTSGEIVDAFSGAKVEIDQIVKSILASMAKMTLQRAILRGLENVPFFGTAAAGAGSVTGGSGIRVQGFAHGDIVNSPTMFAHGGGIGIMGEVPGVSEAIVPLKRSSTGDLGVGASPVNIVINNNNGSVVKAEESRGATGERQIQIMIDKAVEEGLGRGRYDRVLSTSFGVPRKGR